MEINNKKKQLPSIKRTLGILVLILLMCSLVVYATNKAFGIDEFEDSYENENYIQSKVDVSRNSSLNCMELNYTETGQSKIENFTTYYEYDPYSRITINSATLVTHVTDKSQSPECYLLKDFGEGFFTNFTHDFEFKSNYGDEWNHGIVYGVGNHTGGWLNLITTQKSSFITLNTYRASTTRYLYLYNGYWDNGIYYIKSQYVTGLGAGVWYYCTTYHVTGNTTIKLWTTSDRSGSPAFTLTVTDSGIDESYRYAYVCMNYYKGGLGRIYTNQMRNFDFYLGGGYLDFGNFTSTDLLLNINGSIKAILINSTIPNNDLLKIKFSSDNSNWFDHNNVSSQYDNVPLGYEAIDLRDLNYSSSFYYNMRLEDNEDDSTPRVYDIILITTGISENGNGEIQYDTSLFIVGFIIAMVVFLGVGIKLKG